MARYVKDFVLNADAQTVYSLLGNYLTSEGYEYTTYEGEAVFKKGDGWVSGPTFFKFAFYGNTLRMETWMKYAILPGVFAGEIGLSGFVGCAVKGPWKKRIFNIETILANAGAVPTAAPAVAPVVPAVQPTAPAPQPAQSAPSAYCSNCGTALPAGSAFCSNCGRACQPRAAAPYAVPAGQVSRKEFIDNYADPSVRKSIRNIAILCYICVGATLLAAFILSPWSIIDAALLLGFTLGMHLGRSKVCSYLILALGIIEVVVGLFFGSFPFLWLIAGIAAVTTFSKVEKQYKSFKANTTYNAR